MSALRDDRYGVCQLLDRAALLVWPMSRGHAALLGFGAFDEVGDYGEGGDERFVGGITYCVTVQKPMMTP